jgi:hypothetical protein
MKMMVDSRKTWCSYRAEDRFKRPKLFSDYGLQIVEINSDGVRFNVRMTLLSIVEEKESRLACTGSWRFIE